MVHTHSHFFSSGAMSSTTPAAHEPTLPKSDLNLIWLDCEMSGLNPNTERILEIAVVVTGPNLEPRIDGPVLVIHQSDDLLAKMDKWNQGTHKRSGLIDKVRTSTLTEAEAEAQLLAFLSRYIPKGRVPLCGNTVHQDRRFLVNYMPKLEAYFHYRCVDVSTLKELALRWQPEIVKLFKKKQRHTALADVHESIDELAHYRSHFRLADASIPKPTGPSP
jgi:oligoribonuclease